MDNKQNFQRRTFTFCVDGLTSVIASVMGSSGITAFVESASGIRAGGRTGLTALTVALYFGATLFFNPLICEHPPCVLSAKLAFSQGNIMQTCSAMAGRPHAARRHITPLLEDI